MSPQSVEQACSRCNQPMPGLFCEPCADQLTVELSHALRFLLRRLAEEPRDMLEGPVRQHLEELASRALVSSREGGNP